MYSIPGLVYIPNYFNDAKQRVLINEIDRREWDTTLKRRTQHYGYRYDYTKRTINRQDYLGPFPDFINTINFNLQKDGLTDQSFSQAIVNEYQSGQGIAPHIDAQDCFAERIISLSLGCTVPMVFKPNYAHPTINTMTVWLEPGSLLMLSSDARYRWSHSIPARKSDDHPDYGKQERTRRISITLRKVIWSD